MIALNLMRVRYDKNGNVTLVSDEAAASRAGGREPLDVSGKLQSIWTDARSRIHAITGGILAESGRQYAVSARGMLDLALDVALFLGRIGLAIWRFLTQPVWIPGRGRSVRRVSRGALFALDVVRFGGTFAALFAGLFLTLNYQSFLSIMEANVDPLSGLASVSTFGNDLDETLKEKLRRAPGLAVAGRDSGDMLSFLPAVGPPQNRIIIPALKLNVPIAVPAIDSLLREDWEQLEIDIQNSLQNGVVHYPGTARPGQPGNFFITGHSSYYPWAEGGYKSVFARLHQLQVGDEYWVFYGGDRHRYVVQSKTEVKPSDVSVLDQPTTKRIATLMTCTPVGTTLRRLIISAQEVDPITGLAMKVGEHQVKPQNTALKTELLPI